MSVSNALQEVWGWKDIIAKETHGMNNLELLNYFRKGAEQFEKETGYVRQEEKGYYTLKKI